MQMYAKQLTLVASGQPMIHNYIHSSKMHPGNHKVQAISFVNEVVTEY